MPPSMPPGFPQMNTPLEPMRVNRQPKGFLAALGSPDNMAQMAAGLKSVGQNWNKPGLAAFAGSAGAAMEGGIKHGQHEDEQQMKRNQQQFSQVSTAYNDLLKAQAAGDTSKVKQATARWFDVRAKQAEAGGGGTNAWQNTPYGRAVRVIRDVQAENAEAMKTMREQWKLNGTPEAQQQQQLAQHQAKMQARAAEIAQHYGLNWQQAQQLGTMGLEPPKIKGPDGKDIPNPKFNPFDVRGMTEDHFKSVVPKGGFYRDIDGQVYERKYDVPKSLQKSPEQKQSENSQSQQDHETDKMAMDAASA
jgi:hypothetical protein